MRDMFIPVITVFLLESCVPAKMTSHVPQPMQPHVVLLNGDTIFAHSVVVRERFLNSKIVVDSQKVFRKNDILYAHTNWGHRYYTIKRGMMEQVVVGRINVYSRTSLLMQNHPWKPDSTGIYKVRFDEVKYLQKGTARVFIKPTSKAVAALVADYNPSLVHIKSANQMRSWSIATIPAGFVFGAAGFGAAIAGFLNHKNPDAEKLVITGASCMALGVLSLSVALPTLKVLERRQRRLAIEVYNNRD